MVEKQLNKDNIRKYIIGIIIGSAAMIVLFFIVFFINKKNDNLVSFGDYLEQGNYGTALEEYKSVNEPFDDYLSSIIDKYNALAITYDEAILLLEELKNNGFAGDDIEEAAMLLEMLHESKEKFADANNLYNSNKHKEAEKGYSEVVELDANFSSAQEKIAEIDGLLAECEENYSIAADFYLNNETEKAYKKYKEIINSGVNIDEALNRISKIEDVARAWEAEFQDESKCSYPFGAYAKDDIVYLPYTSNSIHTIVKYNLSEKSTEMFALTKLTGNLIIKDINIIDNYIYFIAGENVGSGKTYDNPYNVYRMKDDGTDLELAALGDYKNLIAYKDGFYAASYSRGIVKLDRNLKLIDQICENVPVQMQLVFGKLYYTIEEYTPYDMINALYVYEEESPVKLKQETLFRFGFYSGIELNTYKAYEYYEKLFFINAEEDKNFLLKFDDIKNLYGLVGSNIVYSMETRTGKDDYFVYSRVEQKEKEYTYKVPKDITELNSIYFEKELIIFSKEQGFRIADSNFIFIDEIDLSNIDIEKISVDNDISFANNPIYTDEEVVIVEDGFWHYSSSTYHISVESKYINDVDTNVYIAHIKTTDPEGIFIDSPADDTHLTLLRKNPLNLSRQFDAVLACNGDFFDEPANAWTGISIRDGVVYKRLLKKDMMAIYPGGRLVCHTAEENIRYEELLYDGVRDTLSFGPILLTKGEYGSDIYTNFIAGANPRCAIGMVEPGHYVIILADGRQPNSAGITLKRLADLFIYEGCVEAYNLDGGQSAALIFMGEYINTHRYDYTGKGFRAIGEIVYFGTSDLVPDEIN